MTAGTVTTGTTGTTKLGRADVVGHRVHATQLDRPVAERPLTDAVVFDLGVQDTGRDGASWALANRGVPVAGTAALEREPDVALVWTLRSAPHYYRRADLLDVLTATSPYSEVDAVKRVVSAGKPLKEAGITTLDGLAEVARQMRRVVRRPMGKGEVSTALTGELEPAYLRRCVPCNAVHPFEVPFRMGALYGGLELQPGTSPPVLQRIADWPRRRAGPASDPMAAPDRLQPIRRYLELLGPATPHDVAGFLDAPVTVIKQLWPTDAVPVEVDGRETWVIGEVTGVEGSPPVRLLGPYDLLLQARDREVLVPDTGRHKALWPVIGRPGGVLVGTDLVGLWRPKSSGSGLALTLDLWSPVRKADRGRLEEQAAELAAHRGVALAAVLGW